MKKEKITSANKTHEKLNEEFIGAFRNQSMNDCVSESKDLPPIRKLFSVFWSEGELSILFGDSNSGKSLLAVQICDAISRGKQIGPFELEVESQTCLFFDFEMSSRFFGARYVKNGEVYEFDPKCRRVFQNSTAISERLLKGDSYEKIILESVEENIIETGAKVIVIDNVTFLDRNLQKSEYAQMLMHKLLGLRNTYDLSILVIAHCPKRSGFVELNQNDLRGAKSLMDLVDSAFAIGQNYSSEQIRYIKQIKSRNQELRYGRNNVVTSVINKDTPFLHFDFSDTVPEYMHLKKLDDEGKELRRKEAIKLRESGVKLDEIATTLGIDESTVRKYLREKQN